MFCEKISSKMFPGQTILIVFMVLWVVIRVYPSPSEGRHERKPNSVQYGTILDAQVDEVKGEGSGDIDVGLGATLTPSNSNDQHLEHEEHEENPHKQVDVVDKFLSIVEEYERNKDTCVPGTEFNLGEGVVAQYGVQRFKDQAIISVNQANFLTRIWKYSPKALLDSEYFLYTNVRSMVEGDPDLFAAGNCYDFKEYKNYTLFCPYAYRLPNGTLMVKDLSVEYYYLGNSSEFFYQARMKAASKLMSYYNETVGKCTSYLRSADPHLL